MTPPSRVIDISIPISSALPVWPGDPAVSIDPAARIADGDPVNVSRLTFGTHTGTHLDVPLHVIAGGTSVDDLSLDRLIGPCHVCDLSALERHIGAADLAAAGIPAGTRRLLLKTRNSALWTTHPGQFVEGFVGLQPDAARWIVDAGIDVVGIDYFSIEPFDGSGETHLLLLGSGVVVIEALDLRAVVPGPYALICLPLRIAGGDGAPCRAVLAPASSGT